MVKVNNTIQLTDFECLTQIFKQLDIEVWIAEKPEHGGVEMMLPTKHKRKYGYFQRTINIDFDPGGGIDRIVIGKRKFAIQEIDENLINATDYWQSKDPTANSQ